MAAKKMLLYESSCLVLPHASVQLANKKYIRQCQVTPKYDLSPIQLRQHLLYSIFKLLVCELLPESFSKYRETEWTKLL